ncbi:GNAT family N-acetyltransferase [Streptomyces sp. NPDC051366]|uniref:GNAT family N-acetyltransferase n=1 Tax=Streptomyces sp. NPDC051366 TaxID=3365652 RepID=UPI0037B63A50
MGDHRRRPGVQLVDTALRAEPAPEAVRLGPADVSAVCTHPGHRGRGLATRLLRAVAAGIRERGETPFLHTAASNTAAMRLYESIGFILRRRPSFMTVRAPGGPGNKTAKFS